MNYKKSLQNNIWKNYIYIFLNNLNLQNGIWMIYLAYRGMSLVELGLLEGIFHISSFFMEVPTGIIADLYGRKTSRILGRVASLASTIIMIFSNNFYLYAISFIISAISYNLESGAGEALVYDSLKELDEENSFMKINGRNEMFMNIALVISFILGGLVASKSYLAVYILSAVFISLSLIEAFSFTEPKVIEKKVGNYNPFHVMKNQVNESISVIKNNKKLGFLIIFCEVICAISTSLFFYLQNFWKGNGYSEFKIGIIFSISSLAGALVAPLIYKIEKKIKERGILLLMPFITILCIWGIVFFKYTYVFYIIISIVEGIIFIAVSDYINKLIPSKNRATIISFQSMIFSAFMIFIFPLIGKIGDGFGLIFAFKLLAILASMLYIIHFFFLTKSNKKQNIIESVNKNSSI